MNIQVTYSPWVIQKREYGEERTIDDNNVYPPFREVMECALKPFHPHRISRIAIDGKDVNVIDFLHHYKNGMDKFMEKEFEKYKSAF
jgi:hypothetical protein